MQEVSHSHNVWQNLNEIIQFTPKLWLYDSLWLTSTNILKLGVMREVSHGIFCLWKKQKIILLPRSLSYDVELKSAECFFTIIG